jgi:hypothetical protein
MALGPGSIAFVGYNADGSDGIAFAALDAIAAGTTIYFTDNEWTGGAINSGESGWSWTAIGDVAAGTVVTIENIGSGTITTNIGTVTFFDTSGRGLAVDNEAVYAYIGTSPTQPTAFLAAVANDTFSSAGGSLAETGLTVGTSALELATKDADADFAAFNGSRNNQADFADYASIVNDPLNWITQDGSGDQSADGTPPDSPFSTTPFTLQATDSQTVSFAAGSLNVSHPEGNSGTTLFTFIVERSGGTVGAVEFSGQLTSVSANSVDFVGAPALPLAFSGAIADGSASATVTIEVNGDTTIEPPETFTPTLQSVVNGDTSVRPLWGARPPLPAPSSTTTCARSGKSKAPDTCRRSSGSR